MPSYKDLFVRSPAVFIVVHAETPAQTIRNVAKAHEGRTDGVFLINHSISSDELVVCYDAARSKYPDWWIGLSFKSRPALEALSLLPDSASGLWTSDAGVSGDADDPTSIARAFTQERERSNWSGLYFGGVAFKYQRDIDDPDDAARRAVPFVDVVTTSGKGTGIAASPDKIKTMKQAIGAHPLAVASGITPENVSMYLAWCDCFLVSTGVSTSHEELCSDRISQLMAAVGRSDNSGNFRS